jgi:hypothetical protein
VACGGLIAIVDVNRRLLLFQAIDLSLLSIDLSLLRSRALFALLDLMTDQATRHEPPPIAFGAERITALRLCRRLRRAPAKSLAEGEALAIVLPCQPRRKPYSRWSAASPAQPRP